MHACIHIPTGRLILACSSSRADTILANGESAGYDRNDLVVREVSPEELADLIARNAALDQAARPAAERRTARYRTEVDPLVVVWSSYVVEGATDKAAAVAAEIVAAKARIRADIPG